ncbi:hypothetical protein WA026_007411 [Henosepilachna vigintioctopunctata]|uniref:Uncharacterized protein n=1 Tax=Henosepilachna vigintioctopunctata TaxID=420089 RepID=A0AAW1UVR2_9CUCU
MQGFRTPGPNPRFVLGFCLEPRTTTWGPDKQKSTSTRRSMTTRSVTSSFFDDVFPRRRPVSACWRGARKPLEKRARICADVLGLETAEPVLWLISVVDLVLCLCFVAWQEENCSSNWLTSARGGIVLFKMLSMLTMHRESEDSGNGEGAARHWSVPSAQGRGTGSGSTVEEFVDILQVQQLLLEGSGRGRGSDSTVFGPPPGGHYYGGYGGHHHPHQQHHSHHTSAMLPTSSTVDDLVALWFAGSSASGKM